MLQFQFSLGGEGCNQNSAAYEAGYIEGLLQINQHERIVYEEPYCNVVELAQQLGAWRQHMLRGDVRDFAYMSLDADEPLMTFQLDEEHVHITAVGHTAFSVERYELLAAIFDYLQRLNRALYEINYVVKLNDYLYEKLSPNRQALIAYTNNRYDEAFSRLQRIARRAKTVQSVHNLAWMYVYEEENMQQASMLLQELLTYKPQSPFPYCLAGEVALKEQRWHEAEQFFKQAITYERTREAVQNLAVAYYEQQRYEEAAPLFSEVAGESDLLRLSAAVCYVKAGMRQHVTELLRNWNDEADDFVGGTEIADVWLALEQFEEAKKWFASDWQPHYTSPYVVSRFAYTLRECGEHAQCEQLVAVAIAALQGEMNEARVAELDAHYSEAERGEWVQELEGQLQQLTSWPTRLAAGEVPAFEFDVYATGGCYLFGCPQHGHAEYEER